MRRVGVFALTATILHVDRAESRRAAARRIGRPDHAIRPVVRVMTAPMNDGYFIADRRQAVEMIERLTGQRMPNQTRQCRFKEGLRTGRSIQRAVCETIPTYQWHVRSSRRIRCPVGELDRWRRLCDMVSVPKRAAGDESTPGHRGQNEALPRRLPATSRSSAQSGGLAAADADSSGVRSSAEVLGISEEGASGKLNGPRFAALNGGVSMVDTNDALGGIDGRASTRARIHPS